MYSLIKPWLFSQDSEAVHDRLLGLMHQYPGLSKLHSVKKQKNKNTFHSPLGWKNRIGLAAGFDKNAQALDYLNQIGFGAIEIGTITPKPQIGNDKKRIHRLKQDQALLNWMGFPSHGAEVVKKRIQGYRGDACIGINIGKNKETPNSKAIDDYIYLYKEFYQLATYVTINISSPNTPGLRELQNAGFLRELFGELRKINELDKLCVKLSPDLSEEDLASQLEVVKEFNLGGVIGTNTTSDHGFDKGGLSGKPLFNKSYQFLKQVCENLEGCPTTIVGCGGISNKQDLLKLSQLGIDHFQIYTSFVYQGPQILRKLQ